MEILIPILILVAIAAVCAVLLTVADKYFGVPTDEKEASIRDCLPGANCGACGYNGCDAYAKALASGETDNPSLCIPGGDNAAKGIASILGVEAGDVVEQVAYVACGGTCDVTKRKFDFQGHKSCRTANLAYCGDKLCSFACLGYGDCVQVCPEKAIDIIDGIAHIDPRKCIGCGICTRTCPKGIIHLIPDTSRVVVECSSHAKGAETRKACTNGCIACGKCEKSCPHDAIHVVDNLATIDYSKCTGCGKCAEVCPVRCIHEGNFICGAHF
ncbi:MAG: RnfABCDGE type electron transport complex subunit B [Clostridia bacterium]|nr:RnfABCDGE type electron transport complex subunit B [Clostridia bacterium]